MVLFAGKQFKVISTWRRGNIGSMVLFKRRLLARGQISDVVNYARAWSARYLRASRAAALQALMLQVITLSIHCFMHQIGLKLVGFRTNRLLQFNHRMFEESKR
jgi:hypothetical protein